MKPGHLTEAATPSPSSYARYKLTGRRVSETGCLADNCWEQPLY